MERRSHVDPGYDCIRQPCRFERKCTPQSRHGIHGDEWHYAVIASDGLTAVSLTVFTHNYPESVPQSIPREPPHDAMLAIHHSFLTDPEKLRTFRREEARTCTYVAEGWCDGGVTYSGGAEFFATYGSPVGPPQSETFWVALEQRFRGWNIAVRAARVDLTHQRCPTCHGDGIVRRKEPT